jgi:hypothetical protein
VVFTRLNGGPILLRNNIGQDNHWVGLELQGSRSNRDAIGAKITIVAGKRRIVHWITGGSSYLSSHDKRVLVGLGRGSVGSSVSAEIRWPSGDVQRVPKLELNRYHRVLEIPSPWICSRKYGQGRFPHANLSFRILSIYALVLPLRLDRSDFP